MKTQKGTIMGRYFLILSIILLMLIATITAILIFDWQKKFEISWQKDTQQTSDKMADVILFHYFNGRIYVQNNLEMEVSVEEVIINDKFCNLRPDLKFGVNEIDIRKCIENLSRGIFDVNLITERGETKKQFFLDK